jgi:HlyD family secretion protein
MPSVQERIFRSKALARHASPEGLDTLLEITTVRGWIGLITLAALVAAALVWGVLGRIPQVVVGQGIMVSEGGLHRVQASGAGRIDSVLVNPGSVVKRGQTIATVAQPELRTSIEQLQTTLASLRANRDTTARFLASDGGMKLASIAQQQQQADEAIAAADKRLAYLETRIANEQGAFDKKILTADALQSTIAMRAETQYQKRSAVARKQELSASAVQSQATARQSLFVLEQEIRRNADRLVQLEAQLASFATVTSPDDGVVVERLVDVGQAIVVGTPIATIDPTQEQVQALLFIPLEGKRIAEGMRTEMVPGGVRPEETGYFLGKVRWVSPAPLSGNGLDRYLKNEVLVQQFTSQGGAYLVEVTVETDPAPTSKYNSYKWTSRKGADISFGSGTLLAGRIVVEETRPVALIIPAIKRWLGG